MSTQNYSLVDDPYTDWLASERRGYTPTPRQQALLTAYAAAKEAGKHYSNEIAEFAANLLGLTPEDRSRNLTSVQGGDFTYDLYYARKCHEAQVQYGAEDAAKGALQGIHAGTPLGTLVFNDYKRTTGVFVTELPDPNTVVLQGKRGRALVTITTGSLAIKAAFERATSMGMRKDSFDDFVQALRLMERPQEAQPA